MNRNEAYQLLTKYLQNKNLIKHCFACEAAMKALYKHLTPQEQQNPEDEEKWGITGLLHDIDYEIAQKENKLGQHGLLIFDREPHTIPEDIAHAIKAHSFEYTKVMPETPMDWAITCADQLTGLIVAAALVHPAHNASLPASQAQRGGQGASIAGGPEKKLAPLTVDFIQNRMKSNSFAKGAKREPILLCEEKLGIPLPEFIDITLSAMKEIHTDLGL